MPRVRQRNLLYIETVKRKSKVIQIDLEMLQRAYHGCIGAVVTVVTVLTRNLVLSKSRKKSGQS